MNNNVFGLNDIPGGYMFFTRVISKNFEFLKIPEVFSTLGNCFLATSKGCGPGLVVACLACVLFLSAASVPWAQDICGYSSPEYSVYNRLLRVDVNRDGKKVGEVHFSYQFNGYYVRCVTGGVPKKRFFARARDARWAACGSCY